MTIQALVVSVETGINTVNAEKGPDTLPLNITSLDPISISIKDEGSRLNNKLSSHINDIDLHIRDGNWNDIFQQNFSSTNIIIQDPSDTVIEKTLSNTTLGVTDSAPLNFFEGNGDSVSLSYQISKTKNISSQGPVYDGNNWSFLTSNAISGSETILDITSAEGTPTGLAFKNDGTVLFFCGYSGDAVYSVPLSTAWDISTANMASVTSTGSLGTDVKDLFIKSDGTAFWVFCTSSIREYSMSTAWDLTTSSLSQTTSISNGDSSTAGGLWFKPDGTEMYYNDASSDLFSQYTLTTAWDISTKTSYKSISTHGETGPQGMVLSTDGDIVYVVGSSGDGIDYYTLSTPWDISTRSNSAGFYSLSGITSIPSGIYLKESSNDILYVSFRAVGTINTTIADGILQLPFGDGSIKNPETVENFTGYELQYDSTGDITIEGTSYSPLRIFTAKNFDILSNTSYLPNNTVVNIKLDADELKDVNLKNIQIVTADDIAARSPSFCNAVQESFYIANQVPIGYFEIDGVAEFSDINKNNDPRLVGGSTQTGGDTGGTGGTGGTGSGPIQSWSS